MVVLVVFCVVPGVVTTVVLSHLEAAV